MCEGGVQRFCSEGRGRGEGVKIVVYTQSAKFIYPILQNLKRVIKAYGEEDFSLTQS